MFKLVNKRTVKWPVTIQVPQDGGGSRPSKITCEYELLPQAELDDLLAASGDAAFLRQVVLGIDGLADEDGQTLAYSDEIAGQLFQIVYARNAIMSGYFEALAGGRAKN
jgi:hypothetical protein